MFDGGRTEKERSGDGDERIQPMNPALCRIRNTGGNDEHHGRNDRTNRRERELGAGRLRNNKYNRTDDEKHPYIISVIMPYGAVLRDALATIVKRHILLVYHHTESSRAVT